MDDGGSADSTDSAFSASWLLAQFAPAMSKEPPDYRSERRVQWTPSQPPASDRPESVASLVVARNEVAGVQLHLRSNDAFQAAVDTANWLLPGGHAPRARVDAVVAFVPPQLRVELFVVGTVEDENGHCVFEALSRTGSSVVVAHHQLVYVRLRVGSTNVRPGAYEIPVRVFTQQPGLTDEQLAWSSCVRVRVAPVALPPPHAFRFHLDLWQHFSSIARAHHAPLWSDRHFALIDHYLCPLAELGQKCISVVATEMPWVGQQCYLETANVSALYEHAVLHVYETIPAEHSREERLKIDFQHFDRLLTLAKKHHMDAEIEVFGLLSVWRDPEHGFGGPVAAAANPSSRHRHRKRNVVSPDAQANTTDETVDAWRIRCVNRDTGAVRYLRRVAEIEQFLTLFHSHCVVLGVADRVRVCADEPRDVRVFNAQLQFLHRLAPRFRIKLALNDLAFFHVTPPQVVDYVPLLPLVCADVDATRRMKAHVRDERGGRFCWYVCCHPPFPNQFVSSPLVEGELVGYVTFFLELDGFLRWNYCLWPVRPWETLQWRTPMWPVGDMYFVLPGLDGFPVETLRFEALRFAVQAYELLQLAQDALTPVALAQLKDEVAQLIWRTTDFAHFCQCDTDTRASDLYSLDPMDFQRARARIIDTLAVAGLSSPDGGSGSDGNEHESPTWTDKQVHEEEDVR